MIDYKIKDITLDERIEINEFYRESNGVFRAAVGTLRISLKELDGKKVTDENRDELINKLPADEIINLGYEIAGKVNHLQDKKK